MALTASITAGLTTVGVASKVGDRPAAADIGDKPFVVMWPDAPVRAPLTLSLTRGETTTIVCHCLGLTADSARIGEAKLAQVIYGLAGTQVDGMVVRYPEQLSALPLSRDDDVSPPLYDLVVEWRLRTIPA